MQYIEAKSILSPHNGVNLYRGCSHGCIYCDSRSECYQNPNFEDIKVKMDSTRIFSAELSKRREKVVVHTGAMCDPYIPIENELKITREMLQVIANQGHGLNILTKSTRILRDIDIIDQINHNYKAIVNMTITTFDDKLCSIIEPNVSVSSERFACLKEFVDRGITCGIWLCPILPFINDTEDNIRNIVRRCGEIGIKFIVLFSFGTTKRKGSEEYFYQKLDELFPNMKEKYIKTFKNAYECNSLNSDKLWKVFKEECEKYKIEYDINKTMHYEDFVADNRQLTLF